MFKLITILGALLDRKAIAQDFDPKYYLLADMLELEMDDVKKIFDEQDTKRKNKQQIHVHRNMPDVSGALKWCQELRDRISKPMESMRRLINHDVLNSAQMERIEKKYQEMLELIEGFANGIYDEWCQHVGSLSSNNLDKNLINRDPETNTIKTNFDPQVRYIKIRRNQFFCVCSSNGLLLFF